MTKHKKAVPQKENSLWGWIKKVFDRYFVKAMSGMALGLFSSLIIGLIINQLAKISFLSWLSPLGEVVTSAPVVGAAIGAACAYGLKSKPLAIFSSIATGAIGYQLGGPVGAFVASVVGAEFGNLIGGRTPVDIVLVPIVTIVTGGLAGTFVGPYINNFMTALGAFINTATHLHPFPMGIVVSAIMGLALTAPISSAAIAISLGLDGLAAGAACVGCSAQMIGFAVSSWRENKLGGLLSQGLGTSMLQFGNIMRRPLIWVPPTLTSVILGPVSTVIIKMTNNSMGAGMGTSGLVGPIGAYTTMSQAMPGWEAVVLIAVMCFILPALLSLLISEFMRKQGWIKFGDMQLEQL